MKLPRNHHPRSIHSMCSKRAHLSKRDGKAEGVLGPPSPNLRRAGGAARRYRRDGVRCATLASCRQCTNEWLSQCTPMSG
ncbi:hypothetical protein FHL15_003914 [Xylaria flabelliformis]|uniref:Uncharacterized protein n=1 Tax=Xylaria flabelliformis TaxID=2512241 RepID=A0A553I4U7_9PEZI|nr:hypothetical protein FHL15_003914 [Xylaria flabelliformis]